MERLRDFESDVLRFMVEEAEPFSNNQAENDLRMTKVQQKIVGGTSWIVTIDYQKNVASCQNLHYATTNSADEYFSP